MNVAIIAFPQNRDATGTLAAEFDGLSPSFGIQRPVSPDSGPNTA